MNARRLASLAGTVAVTAVAAMASYDHMRTLATMAGQPPLLAALLPLTADGLMLVATAAIGDGRKRTGSAWAAFLVGMAASLAANVMAADPTTLARAVSAWPAVALLLTVEILARAGRNTAQATRPAPVAAPVAMAAQPSTAQPSTSTAQRPTLDRPSARPVAADGDALAVAGTARTVATATTPKRSTATTANDTATRVAALSTEEPHLSAAEMAERLAVSARTVRRYRSAATLATG